MARKLAAASDLVRVGTASVLPTTAGSVSFWFNVPSVHNVDVYLWQFTDVSDAAEQFVCEHYLDNNWYVGWAGNRVVAADTGTYTAGSWTHIALVYDNSTGQVLYFNGTQKGTQTTGSGSNVNIYIGNNRAGSKALANSVFADFAYWNVRLTPLEITALSKGIRPNRVRQVLAWWPLDGLQSPEPDLSGNAKNGTLTGTALAFGPPFTPFTRRYVSNLEAAAVAPPATPFIFTPAIIP